MAELQSQVVSLQHTAHTQQERLRPLCSNVLTGYMHVGGWAAEPGGELAAYSPQPAGGAGEAESGSPSAGHPLSRAATEPAAGLPAKVWFSDQSVHCVSVARLPADGISLAALHCCQHALQFKQIAVIQVWGREPTVAVLDCTCCFLACKHMCKRLATQSDHSEFRSDKSPHFADVFYTRYAPFDLQDSAAAMRGCARKPDG